MPPLTSGPTTLATASWLKLLGMVHLYQACLVAGDVQGAERIRAEAHDVLDASLDQRAEAAVAVRTLIEGA